MYMICARAGTVDGAVAGELKVKDESQYEGKGGAGGARGAGGAAGAAGDTAGGGVAGSSGGVAGATRTVE
jgi:hypothetical protein